MKKPHCYEYPRPALTADIIVIGREKRPRVLLIRRKHLPFAGEWALPGGFVDEGETLIETARRELHEETGVQLTRLKQLSAYGDPGRDPRGWTVSVAFITFVDPKRVHPIAGDDAAEVGWHPLDRLPLLAFDHRKILVDARRYLKRLDEGARGGH
ncbi:MAG: NUDIX domain-containing protein [Gemmataceae bacterium]